MRISDKKYFEKYLTQIGNEIPNLIENYDFSEKSGDFKYLTKASAVYSSNIEGNSIDLNTFMNYELNKDKFRTGKEIEEIENLIESYEFAQNNKLTGQNLLTCHKILSKTLLIKSKRGKYRIEKVGVFGKSGMTYLAIEPEFVESEMEQFFSQISDILNKTLTPQEIFYYASIIHLRFVHIHPFRDGNGRTARLLEKWFVVEKLGKEFWKMPSEQYYKENQKIYYETVNLGVNYYELNYDRCLGFLEMLPNSLK